MSIAQAVVGIGPIAVGGLVEPDKALESLLTLRHIRLLEVCIAEVVERHLILVFGLRRTTEVVVVVVYSLIEVALLILDLAKPEETQRIILWTHANLLRLIEFRLCLIIIARNKCLQAIEICNLLQCRTLCSVGIRERLDSLVGHLVVVRVVVGSNEQFTSLVGTLRLGVLGDIAGQHIYRLVECATTRLEEELSVVEEGILRNLVIVLLVGSHCKGLNSLALVVTTDIAVCQVVRGILRQLVATFGNLQESLDSGSVVGRTICRVAENVVLLATHLTTRALIHRDVEERLVVALQTIPRLCHNTHKLRALQLHRAFEQSIAILHHILVVTPRKLNLEEVVRDNLCVVIALFQTLETCVCSLILATRIVDIGLVVDCVVGIITRWREYRE